MLPKIQETKQWIESHTALRPTVAIVLGTGLGRLAREIEVVDMFPYDCLPNFPVSTVEGHNGRLLVGRLGGREVYAMEGRFHYYEGYSMQEVTFPVRVFQALGVNTYFVSNAAGGVNPVFKIGDLMLISDHINFLPEHPLRGANIPPGPRFPDMSQAYDREFLQQARQIANSHNIHLHEGIYLANQGPSYETPAEYRMYRLLRADAVGMSTVPEVIVARHCGMRVFGVSVITNRALDGQAQQVSHAEVQKAADEAQPLMALLFKEMISHLP